MGEELVEVNALHEKVNYLKGEIFKKSLTAKDQYFCCKLKNNPVN